MLIKVEIVHFLLFRLSARCNLALSLSPADPSPMGRSRGGGGDGPSPTEVLDTICISIKGGI